MGDAPRAADAIDAAFVPVLRPSVVNIPVEREALLYDEETGVLHQLDPIATIVLELLDGDTSLAEAIEELDRLFEAPRARIETDVLAMAVELGELGLLDGVEAPTEPE
jgi:hypothetical protein